MWWLDLIVGHHSDYLTQWTCEHMTILGDPAIHGSSSNLHGNRMEFMDRTKKTLGKWDKP